MTLRHKKQTAFELLSRDVRVLFFIWSCLLLHTAVSIKSVLISFIVGKHFTPGC